MKEHSDQLDRNLLTNVPLVAKDDVGKQQIYRYQQFMHTLTNFGEIVKQSREEKQLGKGGK